MRNIKMTMPKMQLNSKFVNNYLPEWDRFVTIVKLNKGLKTSNYDQLYAYLKQHEAHANENKMMLERYNQHAIDPLAFISNGAVTAGNGRAQNRVGNANHGQAKQIKCYNCNGIGYITRQCTHPKRLQISEYFKVKMLLMQAQENGVVLDEKQLLFIAGGQTNMFNDDVDEAPTMFMANLSSADPIYDEVGLSYDSNILSEVELLKKELHSVIMKLNSTINHNKLIKEEVATLKKDFKQKENKYLKDFRDMKKLKERVEDKLYKQ
nr:hypothetical protein [Tanacetum cinerariifolium]